MKLKTIGLCLILIQTLVVNAQENGYWDSNRATTKEVVLTAGKRTLITSENFPVGTTEIAFRITSLDENQKLTNGLMSVLKAIPDPTGVSQGSAGAVLLLSQISGEDKSIYHLFSDQNSADRYVVNGKTNAACFVQNQPISKDAKLFSLNNNSCLKLDQKNIFIVVESKNWLLKQKVVVEIVPWVDTKSSKGWSLDSRTEMINLCKTSNLSQLMNNSDDFCVCILNQFQANFSFQDYQKLMAMEKSKLFRDYGNKCLQNTPENTSILSSIRFDALQYFKQKNYDKAIRLLNTGIIESGNGTAIDYNNIGKYYLFTKQFEKALASLEKAQQKDPSELMVQMNMAHLYLLQNNFAGAKNLHKKYSKQNINATTTWKDKAFDDFKSFEEVGFDKELFSRMIKFLETEK